MGGPIERDHLWIWGAASRTDIARRAFGGGLVETTRESWTVKLNLRVGVDGDDRMPRLDNDGVFQWSGNDRSATGSGAGPDRAAKTTLAEDDRVEILKIGDALLVGSKLHLNARYSKIDGSFAAAPAGGLGSETLLDAAGVWRGSFRHSRSDRATRQLWFELSSLVGQSHQLDYGASHRRAESSLASGWPGLGAVGLRGANFGLRGPPQDTIPAPPAALSAEFSNLLIPGADVARAYRDGNADTTRDSTGGWFQESYSKDWWTLSLGFRYDRQRGRNEAGATPASAFLPTVLPALTFRGNDGGFTWANISPRLGISWAVGGERKTVLRFGLSRFVEQLDRSLIERVNPLAPSAAEYSFFDLNGDGVVQEPELAGGPFFCHNCDPSDPASLSTPNVNDPDLDAAAIDEAVAGVEHSINQTYVVGLQLTYRRISGIPEERVLIQDGTVVRPAVANDYTGDGFVTGLLPDGTLYNEAVFSLLPGLRPTGGTLLTNGEREQRYRGITLTFDRRFTGRSTLRGSATWYRWTWRVPATFDAVSDPTDLWGAGDDDGAVVAERSRQPEKAGVWPHSSWSYRLTWLTWVGTQKHPWFDFAVAASGREGYPNPLYQRVIGSDGITREVAVAEFDRFRHDDVFTLDLQLARGFHLGGNRWLTVAVDVFNLLNETVVLQREQNQALARANEVTETLSPRVFRIGLRFRFG